MGRLFGNHSTSVGRTRRNFYGVHGINSVVVCFFFLFSSLYIFFLLWNLSFRLAPASYDDVHHHGTYAQILQIYIEKVPHVMLTFGDQKAKSVMGVFHKLFITKQSIEHAFSLLQQIATYLPHDEIWRLYGRPIVDLLWTRIEKNMVFTRSTVRYAQLLSRYVLRLIAVNGAQSLKLVIDARPGGYTLHDAFQNVMLPALSHKEDERATKEDSSKIYETCLHYLSHCLWNLNDPHNPFAIAYHQGMTLKKEYTTKNLWVCLFFHTTPPPHLFYFFYRCKDWKLPVSC